jgi:CubicO group peptidase (beta-lactamase class C family)
MKTPMLLLVTILLTCSAVYAQKPTDKRLAGLDTFALRVLKEWNAPGVTIAVVEKNKVVYTGGFGYRDNENKLPVTENTLFAIGSCTKAFTASMLGMLESEGKVSLDKPVRDYLPELRFQNEYTNDHVTLRDMMCHRTGLPRHDLSWYGSTASRKELLERIQYQEPSAALRERYQYNNFMFMSQGIVIEKLTGKSWEENLRERILLPLGMTNTVMSVGGMEQSADKSFAYEVKETKITKIPYRNIDAIGPAGSINSSAKDMANWLITWINDGKFNNKQIIPASYRNQAITPHVVSNGGLPGAENPDVHFGNYGLAWGMVSYRGHFRVEHGGGIDGFITSTGFFPSDSIGIFVVSNQGGPTTAIRNFIADRMLKLSYRDWSSSQLAQVKKANEAVKTLPNGDSLGRKPNTKPSHAMEEYAGRYENKGYGVLKLFMERDTLWIDYNEGGKRTTSYLQHYHFDVFSLRSTEETEVPKNTQKLKFNLADNGDIANAESQLEQGVKTIVFEKLPPEMKIGKADLEKYTGEYNLSGTTIKVYIREPETLMVLVPGQPDYELVPAGEHLFNLKIVKGYSVKFDLENSKVTALSFLQPNGTFKADRKK